MEVLPVPFLPTMRVVVGEKSMAKASWERKFLRRIELTICMADFA